MIRFNNFLTKKIICFLDFSHLFLSLVYTPCLDCFGDEEINILLKENQTSTDIPPSSSHVTINVYIQPINDPPVVFLTRNGLFLGNEDITEDTVVCTMNSLLCVNWRKTHNETFLKSNSKTSIWITVMEKVYKLQGTSLKFIAFALHYWKIAEHWQKYPF